MRITLLWPISLYLHFTLRIPSAKVASYDLHRNSDPITHIHLSHVPPPSPSGWTSFTISCSFTSISPSGFSISVFSVVGGTVFSTLVSSAFALKKIIIDIKANRYFWQIIKQGPSSNGHDNTDIIWKELVIIFCFLPKNLEKKK